MDGFGGRKNGAITIINGKPRMYWNKIGEMDIKDPTEKAESLKYKRELEMMHWILVNNLDLNVSAAPNEINEANQRFGAKWDWNDKDPALTSDSNALGFTRIQNAYALMMRNLSPRTADYDTVSLGFSRDFYEKTGLFPGEYYQNGPISLDALEEDNRWESTPGRLSSIDADILNVRRAIAEQNSLKDAAINSPLGQGIQGNIDAATKELELVGKLIKQSGGNPEYVDKVLKPRLDAAQKRLTGYNSQIEMLKYNSAQAATRLTNYQADLNNLLAIRKSVQDDVQTYVSMSGEKAKAGEAKKGLFGLNPADKGQLNGYLPRVLRTIWADRVVPRKARDVAGRLVVDREDPAEFITRSVIRDPSAVTFYGKQGPSEKQMAAAYVAHNQYRQLETPLVELMKVVDTQLGQNFAAQTLDKIIDPYVSTKQAERNAIIGALRTAIIGPGNPSNFEQEVLRDSIPDVSEIASLAIRNKQKLKSLGVLAILSHMRAMEEAGLEMGSDTLALYNAQLGKVIGKNLTPENVQGIREYLEAKNTVYRQRYPGTTDGIESARIYRQDVMAGLETMIGKMTK
jgi:hypothetical protein